MQVHARVCEENKLEKGEKIQCLLKQFCGGSCEFEKSYRKSREAYHDDIQGWFTIG